MKKDNFIELWNKNVGTIATEMDQAFHAIMQNHPEVSNAAIMMGALAIEAGHILQQMESYSGYTENYRKNFVDVMERSYQQCMSNPHREVLESVPIGFENETINKG